MDYFFSEISANANSAKALLGKLANHSFHWDDYMNHRLVWEFFADTPEQDRDFLFRTDWFHGRPRFLTVSHRKPRVHNNSWQVRTKVYHPQLTAGTCLDFDLRVNPVRTKEGKRHDVVMDLKRSLSEEERNHLGSRTIEAQAGNDWLSRQAAKHGFTVESDQLMIDGYRQVRFRKKGHQVRLSTLDFRGQLKITEPDRFRRMLVHGLGPAKGFGCGLMLVRRPL